jgi:hypothetical protein
LLGPDAAAFAAGRLRELGATVVTAPSPWRLTGSCAGLTAAWFEGWLGAAVDQRPALGPSTAGYARWRRQELAAGRVQVSVQHVDLLAWWP